MCIRDRFYTDAAFSVVAGDGNSLAQKLVEVTEKSLYEGIKRALPGNRIGDISHAIQETIESAGFSVVRDFVGHGVGRALHEEPQIPNFGKKNRGVVIEEGMVLAIEPMACLLYTSITCYHAESSIGDFIPMLLSAW